MANPNETRYAAYPTTGKGSIANGSTLNISFGSVRVATSLVVTNFDSTNVFEIMLNSQSNDKITIPPNQSMVFNAEYISSVYITNTSGSSIEFQAVILGA